jgi:hypothetical protein
MFKDNLSPKGRFIRAQVLFFLIFFVHMSKAQDFGYYEKMSLRDTISHSNSLVISPFALVVGNYYKMKVRLQHETDNVIGYGMDIKYYFNDTYPGFQLSPFLKLFPFETNSSGVYIIIDGVYGRNKGLPDIESKYYNCYGAGIGFGYQIIFGQERRGIIDISTGLKYLSSESGIAINNVPEKYDDYFVIGPGSFYDGSIGIGYKF